MQIKQVSNLWRNGSRELIIEKRSINYNLSNLQYLKAKQVSNLWRNGSRELIIVKCSVNYKESHLQFFQIN
jgi:uncharacterized protein with von Willebrand factor type A (vWA) domain